MGGGGEASGVVTLPFSVERTPNPFSRLINPAWVKYDKALLFLTAIRCHIWYDNLLGCGTKPINSWQLAAIKDGFMDKLSVAIVYQYKIIVSHKKRCQRKLALQGKLRTGYYLIGKIGPSA